MRKLLSVMLGLTLLLGSAGSMFAAGKKKVKHAKVKHRKQKHQAPK